MDEHASLGSHAESDLASKEFNVMTQQMGSSVDLVLRAMLAMGELVKDDGAVRVDLATQVRNSYN